MNIAQALVGLLAVSLQSEPANQVTSAPTKTGCDVLEGPMKLSCEKNHRRISNQVDCEKDAPVWRVRRATDPITDSKSCAVLLADSASNGSLLAIVLDRQLSFTVMGDKYPGADLAIRVDANKPYVFGKSVSGSKAKLLLSELRAGKSVATRYNEWPSHVNRDSSSPTCDIAALIDDCQKY